MAGRSRLLADGEPSAAQEGRQEVGSWCLSYLPTRRLQGPLWARSLLLACGLLILSWLRPRAGARSTGRKTRAAGVLDPRTLATDCLVWSPVCQVFFFWASGPWQGRPDSR